MVDRSNGYEGIAAQFISARSPIIGVTRVRDWAKTFTRGAAVIDLGCGPGVPITRILVSEGLSVYGIDAAPSFVQAFRRNLPNTPIACEAVQDSNFFGRTFDGVLAWGFMFVLSPEDQRQLIQKIGDLLVPGGRFLFTSPAEMGSGTDILTGREFHSLGAEEYRRRLSAAGLAVAREYQDEGGNHYFDASKDLNAGRPKPETCN